MKKITFLLFLLCVSLGYAQQQEYHLDFEDGTPSGVAANWFTFDNSPAPAEVIDNPDLDGVNSTASKVLKVVVGSGNAFYAGVNNKWEDSKFGTWKIDLGVASNSTLTMDVNKNYVGTVGIKMSTNTGGTTFQITDQNVGNTVVDEWQTLTFDLSGINPNGDLTNISQMVVFVDWTEGMADRADGNTILIDNIKFNAEKLTDAPAPSVAGSAPTTDAPTPPARAAGDVLSIYSDAYTNVNVTNFNPGWGQSGAVDAAFDPTGNGTNTVLKYSNFNYQGTEFDATDASGMDFVHIDIWTADATDIKFSPINNGTGAGEFLVNVPLITGSWSSVDIAIADFTGMTWDSLFQMKFDGQGGVNPSTIYIDNVYFYKGSPAVATAPTTDAPTPPTRAAGDVLSIYSDAYTNVNVTNFNPGWGQSGAVDAAYDPTGNGTNTVLKYSNFNYQGTEFDATDASGMDFVHIDIWTADATDIKFSPINNGTGAGEFLVNVPLVTGSWSSVDIAIADFTGMTWDSLFQMKFDGQGGVNPSTIYIDNVYFYKGTTTVATAPTTDAPTPPTRAAGDVLSIYSDAYTNVNITNFNPGWGQSGAVDAAYDPTGNGTNTVLKYSNFNYQGTEFDATDASGMDFVHIDIWTADATDIKFSPINNGTGAGEFLVNVPLVTGSWSSVDIAIADFTGMTWDSLFQMKFDGQGGVNPSTIYVDNVYFYKSNTASIKDNTLANLSLYPNPATNFVTISADNTIDKVSVYNILGKTVKTISVNDTSKNIDISDLNSGIYLIKFTVNNAVGTAKFIKR
ncbi:T9SS type A sorting domain-containing protein [Polaribacter haliotis]|uniref:T9SS type A sorting domain-containing protein n=1 Tax=Polaribacter haliotis TaxID=1888915 RepID=A0A7L8AGF3_9FLAO|nr:T9SS type A sorting domain-containing protein [Polaribacter haliotis]QOD60889.1 T9SS type A sorting domain-containing protein [Polaribacter haliotis]